MKQEDKQLLLEDLCARLPYGVMVLVDIDKKFDGGCISKLTTITEIKEEKMFLTKNSLTPVTIEEIRPYLQPMSSMTEEEYVHFMSICGMNLRSYEIQEMMSESFSHPNWITIANTLGTYSHNIDWLNKSMFDYRGLIEKGLAIEVTEENNPYKN